MSGFIDMLRKSGVIQVMDWSLFQKQKRPSFHVDNPENATDTVVWVKFNHNISKHTFDIGGVLRNIESETPECVVG